MLLDRLFPPPPMVRRRAWEAAFDMRVAHLGRRCCPLTGAWLRLVVRGGPEAITWPEIGELFQMHRRRRPVRQ